MSYLSWTEPATGVHPRLWINSSTLSIYQSRIASTHASAWSALISWCNGKLSQPGSYFEGQEPEHSAAFAWAYLLDPTKTTLGQKGREVALYIANLTAASEEALRRKYAVILSLLYDWCYPLFTDSERATVRARIALYVDSLRYTNPVEYLWGHAHGNNANAIAALPAILGDGSSSQNATWHSWMDDLLDAFDNNTNTSFFAGFRHYGSVDGGTHKGCGVGCYFTTGEEWYQFIIPALRSSIGIDWSDESWWVKTGYWWLWNWRGDRTFYRQGEQRSWAHYLYAHQIQLWNCAHQENNDFGKACQWFSQVEIPAVGDYTIYGPYHMHTIYLWNPDRPPVKPTITNQGGRAMHIFSNVGRACFRSGDGWNPTDPSLTFTFPKTFTGGHTHRDVGAICLSRTLPLICSHGRYYPSQGETYKDPNSSTITGHRYTYYARTLSYSGISIYDSDEPSENVARSFQRFATNTMSRFGVLSGGAISISNDGGLLWPKGQSGAQYQPRSIDDVLTDSVYQFATERHSSYSPDKYEYLVTDLTPWYYSAKVTKVRRHVLWILPGTIPGWTEPIAMVFDDLVTHVDGTAGKLTQRLLWQTQVTPTGTASSWQIDRAPDRCFVRVLHPSVEWVLRDGYLDLAGVEYPSLGGSALDDSVVGVHRVEINPASSGTNQQFLTLLLPCASTVSSPPTIVLIDDGSWIGATIGGVACKIAIGDTHSASVGTSPDTTPPAVPTGLSATGGNASVTLNWTDNVESDFDHYEVWRRNSL